MSRDDAFEFLDRAARGIAEMFGPACETLVHDMSLPTHPILSIYNGHVSGREAGSTMDILGAGRALDEQALRSDQVNLLAATPSGRQIKSSTFHLMGEGYNLALGINFDFTCLAEASRAMADLMYARSDLRSALWRGGEGQLEELFAESLNAVGKSVPAMTKQDRLRVVSLLRQKNAFSFRKAVPYVSQRLGVSRYTIYKYLGELEQAEREGEQ